MPSLPVLTSLTVRRTLAVLAVLVAAAVAAPASPTGAVVTRPGVVSPMVVAGATHTCVLTAAGGVLCWGRNEGGQLGDGTFTTRTTPAPVTGLGSGVVHLAASASKTCAITAAGALLCWGANSFADLGDGTSTPRPTPVAVDVGGQSVGFVGAGSRTTCAVTTTGAPYCWGDNGAGQVGDGTQVTRWVPTPVSDLSSGVVRVASTANASCAVLATGAAKCWGRGIGGELGNGSNVRSLTPVDVTGVTDAVDVTAGTFNVCARTTQSSVLCWGSNQQYVFGMVHTGIAFTPIAVPELASGVTQRSDGNVGSTSFACAVVGGAGQCWGDNSAGQVGTTAGGSHPVPEPVAGLTPSTSSISAGGAHACAITTDGVVRCWGSNTFGQLGNGTTVGSSTPIAVPGLNVYEAPSITASATSAPGPSGWYTDPVTVTFDCASDIVATCPSPVVLSTDGAGQVAGGMVTDLAGRSAGVTAGPFDIDTTPPGLAAVVLDAVTQEPATPGEDGAYADSVVVRWVCSDAASGSGLDPVTACPADSTVTADGEMVVSATIRDVAGNVTSVTLAVRIKRPTDPGFAWSGFFQPVDNLPTVNRARAGSAVPVTFGLGGDHGLAVFAPGHPASQRVSCSSGDPIDDIEETVTAGASSLQYDPVAERYTYVWKTDRSWPGQCRQLVIRLTDGSEHRAAFVLR